MLPNQPPSQHLAPTYHQDLKWSERMIKVTRVHVHVRKLELHKFLVCKVISQSQMYHDNDYRQGDFNAILFAMTERSLQSVDLLLWSRCPH